MEKIDSAVRRLCKLFFWLSMAGILTMMFLIAADVLLRFAINKSIMGSYELVQILMVILVFFAFGFTQEADGHVRVTIFIEKFPAGIRRCVEGLLLLIVASAMLMVSVATFAQGRNTITTTSILFIPLKPVYYLASLGALVYAVTALWDAINSFLGKRNDDQDEIEATKG